MKQRIISSVVLWTTVILLVWLLGIYGGLILIAVLSALAQKEVYGLLHRTSGEPLPVIGVTGGTVFLGLLVVFASSHAVDFPYVAALGLTVPGVVVAVMLCTPVHQLGRRLFPTLTGFLLVPMGLGFFAVIGTLPQVTEGQGLFLAVWVVAVAKFSDVGALLIGSRIGRRPLAPSYSPKKTVEGAIGGIATSVAIGCVLPAIFSNLAPVGLGFFFSAFLAALVGALAIFSDLLGSALKRNASVKDSGSGIPGIGGGLDLMDSLLLTGPFACAAFVLFL